MADGVDIDLYADDLEQDFAQVRYQLTLTHRRRCACEYLACASSTTGRAESTSAAEVR